MSSTIDTSAPTIEGGAGDKEEVQTKAFLMEVSHYDDLPITCRNLFQRSMRLMLWLHGIRPNIREALSISFILLPVLSIYLLLSFDRWRSMFRLRSVSLEGK